MELEEAAEGQKNLPESEDFLKITRKLKEESRTVVLAHSFGNF